MSDFRFAIMGAGWIANKFCDAVASMEGVVVCAVASKSMEKASAFAEKWSSASKAAPMHPYASYQEMLDAEKPDAVYIATIPTSHFELTMLCLKNHVPVICEKTMFMNSRDAKEAFAYSEQENVFCMEAMWSRFLPANKRAVKMIRDGEIGKLVDMDMRIGFYAEPGHRVLNPEIGGGATYDLTCYLYEVADLYVGKEEKSRQMSIIWDENGVDVTQHILLEYEDMTASLACTFLANCREQVTSFGTKGSLILAPPHFPSAVTYVPNAAFDREVTEEEAKKQMITWQEEDINGFRYEIQEVVDCVRAGKCESDVVPHALTIRCAELADEIMATRPAK